MRVPAPRDALQCEVGASVGEICFFFFFGPLLAGLFRLPAVVGST